MKKIIVILFTLTSIKFVSAQINFNDWYSLPMQQDAYMARSADMNNNGKTDIIFTKLGNGSIVNFFIAYQTDSVITDSIVYIGSVTSSNTEPVRTFAIQKIPNELPNIIIGTNGNNGVVLSQDGSGNFIFQSLDSYSNISSIETFGNAVAVFPSDAPSYQVRDGSYVASPPFGSSVPYFHEYSQTHISGDSILYTTYAGGVYQVDIGNQSGFIHLENPVIHNRASTDGMAFFQPETMVANNDILFWANTLDGSYRIMNKVNGSSVQGSLPFAPGLNSVIADLDNDGAEEIINYKDDKVFIYKYVNNDLILVKIITVPHERQTTQTNYYYKHALSVGDYNNDGHLDIALTTQEQGVVILENQPQQDSPSDTLHISYITVIDTLYESVYDTSYVVHTDTVIVEVNDTHYVSIADTVIEIIYDTVTTTTIDTLYEVITEVVHDTLVVEVIDTMYNTILDTVITEVYDTSYITVLDTVIATVVDTQIVEVIDTLYEVITEVFYDTVRVEVIDTNTISIIDTNYVTITDTVTVHVYDTITVQQESEVIASLDELGAKEEIILYPNPTHNIVYLKNTQYYNNEYFEIYGHTGVRVLHGLFQESINIGHFSSGGYYLKIKNKTIQFIKN